MSSHEASLTAFDDLLNRLRRGDSEAIAEFVRTYEEFIRRAIRPRIKRANLNAVADSADVCQSVLGSFLIRLGAGEYELQSEQHLRNLLFTIARKKFAFLVRREYADRRDRNRHLPHTAEQLDLIVAKDNDNPQHAAQHRDLMEQVRARLMPEDLELLRLRQAGLDWKQIALQLNGSPVLLRKRFSRALNRVAVELGFEEHDE